MRPSISDGARCLEVGGTLKFGLTGGLSRAPYARVCKFGLITRPIFSNSGGYVPPGPRGSVTAEQDPAAVYSASVKELVQITTLNNLDHLVLTGQL